MDKPAARDATPTTLMQPSNELFESVRQRAVREIEDRYRIQVIVADVPAPFTGDLDGVSIVIDNALPPDESLFITVHLFGHSVQWNTDPDARAIGLASVDVGRVSRAELDRLANYERTAARYSVQLLHDVGELTLDHWLSEFAAADTAYLMHYYQTGEKLPLRGFWKVGSPVLEPLSIPPFEPHKWTSRSGVVI